MCNCKNMMRDAASEGCASLPLSEHHPKCEDYKLIKYARIALDGTPAIMELDDAQDYINDLDDNDVTDYTYMEVFMTKDQFERLPEFAGW